MNNVYHRILKTSKLLFLICVLSVPNLMAQDGEALFKANCGSCHNPIKDLTGPKLKGTKAKWEKAGDDIYAWVNNPQAQYDAGVKSALAIQYSPGGMAGIAVSKEEIDAIFAYADAYEPPVKAVVEGPESDVASSGGNNTWLWMLIVGLILMAVIVSLWGVRRQLKYAVAEKEGEEVKEEDLKEEVDSWMWRNLKLVSVLGFVAVCIAVGLICSRLYQVGVYENYVPEQPIAFNHQIHPGENEIDCQYCHTAASKSRTAGIPSVNVCMNCHKGIKEGRTAKGTAEIAKIHEAAGFDPKTNKYTGKTKPVKWVKAHNLPDHVYFNHSQHVVVGKIECENCHGPVKSFTVGRTSSNEAINNMELTGVDEGKNKNIIKLENDILTMGWCIECHGKSDVKMEGSEYYDDIHKRLKKDKELYKSVMKDGKVNVKEFGGWECSKCHY